MKTRNYSFVQAIVNLLSSVQLTVVVLACLIPAAILGTVIPQARPWQEYVDLFGWNLFRVFYFLWLTDIFKSFWFIGLLLLLGLNIAFCSIKSWVEKKRNWGFIVIHLSLILLIVGGCLSAACRIRGFVQISEGETVDHFTYDNKKIPLGFSLRLKDFKLIRYDNSGEKLIIQSPGQDTWQDYQFRKNIWTQIVGTPYQFRVEKFILDFTMNPETGEVSSASGEANNPAVLVHIQGEGKDFSEWVFAKYPGMHPSSSPFKLGYQWKNFMPKDFVSELDVIKHGVVVKSQRVEVNHPLRFKGFSIYQSSYDPDKESWSGFEVVSDPGTWIVYVGMLGFMIGLFHNIYLKAVFDTNKQVVSERFSK